MGSTDQEIPATFVTDPIKAAEMAYALDPYEEIRKNAVQAGLPNEVILDITDKGHAAAEKVGVEYDSDRAWVKENIQNVVDMAVQLDGKVEENVTLLELKDRGFLTDEVIHTVLGLLGGRKFVEADTYIRTPLRGDIRARAALYESNLGFTVRLITLKQGERTSVLEAIPSDGIEERIESMLSEINSQTDSEELEKWYEDFSSARLAPDRSTPLPVLISSGLLRHNKEKGLEGYRQVIIDEVIAFELSNIREDESLLSH